MELIRLHSEQDVGRYQFLMRAYTLVAKAQMANNLPSTPLDLVFYIERMSELYDQRESLSRIFAGEDLRWWGD